MSDVTCDQPTYDGAWRLINQRYVTPSDTPTGYACRRIRFPDEPQFRRALVELISRLSFCDTWDETPGGLTSIEAAALGSAIVDSFNDEDVCMIGMIVMHARDSLPDNMLRCDGTIYNRVDYPYLYGALATEFIVDADTFMTPLIEGVFPIGATVGGDYPMNATGGEADHTLTTAEMPVHTHTQDAHNHSQNSHTHEASPHDHFVDEHGGHTHSMAHLHTANSREGSTGGNSGVLMEATATGTSSTVTIGGNSTNTTGSASTGITLDNTVVGISTETATNIAATATNQNAGSGNAHNNMPPYRAFPFAIIAK